MSKKKKYTNSDAVYKNLQDYFAKKNFEIGEKVPAERDIANALKVNRTTLRSALKRMVDDNLLERQVGVGTFFKTNPKKLAESYTRVKTECCPVELLKIRMMLEPQVAAIVAATINPAEVKQLRSMCQLKKKHDVFSIKMIDIKFHDKLVEIAQNNLLSDIYSVIICARNKAIEKCGKDKTRAAPFLGPDLWAEHQEKLFSAFENNSSAGAEKAVKNKLEDIMKLYGRLG